ncbi:class I SAM-dependent methyltransferase [Streptomyces sp. NPDC060035]
MGQVVVAAGMDTRTARLPRPQGTILYEVDHAELLAVKARLLGDGYAPG